MATKEHGVTLRISTPESIYNNLNSEGAKIVPNTMYCYFLKLVNELGDSSQVILIELEVITKAGAKDFVYYVENSHGVIRYSKDETLSTFITDLVKFDFHYSARLIDKFTVTSLLDMDYTLFYERKENRFMYFIENEPMYMNDSMTIQDSFNQLSKQYSTGVLNFPLPI